MIVAPAIRVYDPGHREFYFRLIELVAVAVHITTPIPTTRIRGYRMCSDSVGLPGISEEVMPVSYDMGLELSRVQMERSGIVMLEV
jgi:hypothetical protein